MVAVWSVRSPYNRNTMCSNPSRQRAKVRRVYKEASE